MEQLPEGAGDVMSFAPMGSRTKSQKGKSQVSGEWRRPKKCPSRKWSSSSRRKETEKGRRMETSSINCIDM